MKPLDGRIALVTGASRGAGKGIAIGLAEAGATVYITGRTGAPNDQHETVAGKEIPGALSETVAEISERGGKAIPIPCNHRDDAQVARVFEQIQREAGALDVLVNNAYQSHEATSSGMRFWEAPIQSWDNQMTVGLRSAYVASQHAARMMIPRRKGLIVNISSRAAAGYILETAYCVTKAALDRLAGDMAHELRPHGVAALSLWPGALRTEKIQILESLSLAPADLHRDSESTHYSGRAVAGLAADPNIMEKSGKVFTTRDLGDEYGFTDIDGSQPVNSRRYWPPPPPAIYPS
jgi:dehydrogenase/reductase SDR family member 1